MKKYGFILLLLSLVSQALAQPEFYAEPYIGYPEFNSLALRWPTAVADSIQFQVAVRILYDDLQFLKEGDHFQAHYGLEVFLLDKRDQILAKRHLDRKITVANYALTNSRSQGDQNLFNFMLPLADAWMRIVVTDEESRKSRTLEKEILFPAKDWKNDLRLGDLALYDSTGQILMNAGLLPGQPLIAVYSLYCSLPDSLVLEYQLINDFDQIVQHSPLTSRHDAIYQLDTLRMETKHLTTGSYCIAIEARSGARRLARTFSFKMLWGNLPDFVQDLEAAVKQLRYVGSDEELERFQTAPLSQREELFLTFWKKRDPTPNTPANERMEEYYRRVRYVNENYSSTREGWETDRGHVYILFGPPSDLDRHPFNIDKKPYEIWYYYDINRQFLFVDEDGFGDYRLRGPIWEN